MDSILIVDDETFYIDVLVELLAGQYKVVVAKNGQQALDRIAKGFEPDLVLLDVVMPEMDGYQVCQALKDSPSTCDIPVIFLTVKSDVDSEIYGFDIGAADYIAKPFSLPIVKARVATHLDLSRAKKRLQAHNLLLEAKVIERTQEISRTQDVAIFCMATVAETRDNETGKHLRRTQHYVRLLANYLSQDPKYQEQLTPTYIDLLYKSAPLHDLGKVGVPDSILLKPSKLTPEEWELMKRHASFGLDALEKAEQEYGSSSFLAVAKEIAFGHHEKWDGSGYPLGISGDAIPLSARLMALADCYDALINRRVYKDAFSYESASEIILEGRGRHFEPAIVDAFIALQPQFIEIAQKFADDE
ncbi:response regulator [Shewanella gelidii]|nr:two-component system response regulator [Shewanella gelidii]MCL1098925.1 two-component system response regulator [Shewanella gelidii]